VLLNQWQLVSPRALKHIQDMEQLVVSGEVRPGAGPFDVPPALSYRQFVCHLLLQARAVLLFVVQRCDCARLCVSKGDPTYRTAVLNAAGKGERSKSARNIPVHKLV
jgi:hypothetical protein